MIFSLQFRMIILFNHLQPFMVYSDDITYKQYETIVNWMKEQILNYKKQTVIENKDYNRFINFRYQFDINMKKSYLFNVLKEKIKDDVLAEYNLNTQTTNEFIRKILISDVGTLFMNALALDDSDLFVSLDIENVIKERIAQLDEEESKVNIDVDKECKNLVIAKHYLDIDELREDNGKNEIYFDSKYDETRYNIIDEFQEQQETMTPDEFNNFLIEHLMTNVGLSEDMSKKEANAMINKKRLITEGDYAFFTDFDNINRYYQRDDNDMWIHVEDLDGTSLTDDTFCNLKKSCLKIKEDCGNMVINKEKIKKQLINDMLEQFENDNNVSNEQLLENLNTTLKYNLIRLNKLNKLREIDSKKYDYIKFTIGQLLTDESIQTSIYSELRDLILSQSDITQKIYEYS